MASRDTHAIKDLVFPLVDKALKSSKIKANYKKYVNDFFSKRSDDVYDSLPCSRILCSETEMDELFKVLEIEKSEIEAAIGQTYYSAISNFNPKAALHAFTVTQLCVIRSLDFTNSRQERDVSILLLAFSGKFYPSLHYRSYPTVVPVRHVMEYVINNSLSQKYDLASKGSVMFKSFDDEDVVYLIQQLHSRIGSFMKNIATEYYKVYDDKDIYMTYSSDSFEQGDYHLADNDALKIERLTESVM